ncbi:MAG: phosphatase PAP2 family protein [Bacteroidetes bacterium]|nr:phosphatase PAP2 family protein [Bacteroidota bacterium]
MIEQLDRDLFLFLNSLHSPFWDGIMYTISAKLTWAPLYLFMLYLFIRKQKRKALVVFLFAVAAITVSDQLSVHAFKEVFERLRPCKEPELKGLVHMVKGKCGGMYGFVSSHAANSFNIAVFSLLIVRKEWYTVSILIWASVVSYSRIYLGVHYPGDILGGALLGIIIGWIFYRTWSYTDRHLLNIMPWFSHQRATSNQNRARFTGRAHNRRE